MLFHASCVAIGGKAVLILGASGSGKSGLALRLMAHGAELVADDQTRIRLRDGWPVASAPDGLSGVIEARGVGLLAATPAPPTRVGLVVDLDRIETERLPPERSFDIFGFSLPLLHNSESVHFAAAIMQYLKGGRAFL